MNFTVEFDPGAENDLLDAMHWYAGKADGLGAEFLRQAKIQEARLKRTPHIHAIDYSDIRRALFGKFPYSFHFRIEDQCVRVLGCVHQSSDPKNWPGA